MSIAQKIIRTICRRRDEAGEEIGIESITPLLRRNGHDGVSAVRALGVRGQDKRSVSYVDHNTLQTGFENADDLLSQSVAASTDSTSRGPAMGYATRSSSSGSTYPETPFSAPTATLRLRVGSGCWR